MTWSTPLHSASHKAWHCLFGRAVTRPLPSVRSSSFVVHSVASYIACSFCSLSSSVPPIDSSPFAFVTEHCRVRLRLRHVTHTSCQDPIRSLSDSLPRRQTANGSTAPPAPAHSRQADRQTGRVRVAGSLSDDQRLGRPSSSHAPRESHRARARGRVGYLA